LIGRNVDGVVGSGSVKVNPNFSVISDDAVSSNNGGNSSAITGSGGNDGVVRETERAVSIVILVLASLVEGKRSIGKSGGTETDFDISNTIVAIGESRSLEDNLFTS
jgi:hypothetical protein